MAGLGRRRFACLLLLCSISLFSAALARHEAHGKDGGNDKRHPTASVGQQERSLDDVRAPQVGASTKMDVSSTSSPRTGSTKCEGRGGDEGKTRRRVECKQRLSGKISHEEFDGATFVAFNADYNAPRHHPPKNN